MNKKKILAVVLVLSLIVSVLSFSASAAADTAAATDTIQVLSCTGYSNYTAPNSSYVYTTKTYNIPLAESVGGQPVGNDKLVLMPLETDQFWYVSVKVRIPQSFLGKDIAYQISRAEIGKAARVSVFGQDANFSPNTTALGGGGTLQSVGESEMITMMITGRSGGAWTLILTDPQTGQTINFDFSQLA